MTGTTRTATAHAPAERGHGLRDVTRRDSTELEAVAADAAERFEALPPHTATQAVLAWAATEFADTLAVACSMADLVLPHVVSEHLPGVDVLFLETGYHFAETLGLRAQAEHELDIAVVDVHPELTVDEQDTAYGPRLHERDPAACCRMRKVEPLAAALAGYEAWVTGVRRDEAPTRTHTPYVQWDARHGLVKLNPLAGWTFDDVTDHATQHRLPANLLLSQGYPSIGCRPCTRQVAPGDDPRSGRWAGLAKTECGIHL